MFPSNYSSPCHYIITSLSLVFTEVVARKANRVYSAEKLVTVVPSADPVTSTVTGVSISATISPSIPEVGYTTVFFVTQGQVKNLSQVGGFSTTVKADFPVADVLGATDFTGKFKTTAFLPGSAEGSLVLLVGLGDLNDGVSSSSEHLGFSGLRGAVHTAVQTLKSKKISKVAYVLPSISFSSTEKTVLGYGSGVKPVKGATSTDVVPLKKATKEASIDSIIDLVARVTVTSNHAFDKYWKTETAAEKNPLLTAFTVVAPFPACNSPSAFEALTTAVNTAESVLMARELGSERADVANPEYMQKIAESLAATYSSIKVTSLQEQELRSEGYNLLAAVGQAATVPPRLVVIEYNGLTEGENVAPIALVGKGITFDTGGLNLKPTGFMEEMHADMCGSAAVISTMRALAANGTKAKVVGVLALAENAIDAKAFKPYDIIESHQGSVLIGNTDAEGRLALADALTYVQNTHAPTTVINIATLTGACVIALGEVAAGIFSNDAELSAEVTAAAAAHNERFWALPILPEHQDDIKGDLADINSTGKTRYGGSSTAAAFLEKFILPGVSWAHLDIAGPANLSSPRMDFPKGISGYGVQTFMNFITKQ